ncbi:hypothetical protein F511_38199 [Dorcoceras hygrometricum]|uniref:Uncharacterized protein n=1 Tax=Dorcoceras hygrometricum TaxID=472368 RepID=A0A2Z7D520_9LAMI|nr:hypothetical protein F511_38199 [Dorcoceras hygrometricum]
MVKRLATSRHDPLGITDSACKNQLVVVSVQYGPFNPLGPQPLWLRNHNFGLVQRIMVKRLATSPHDPLGITDSACKNQLVVVSVQYGPFNPYIPIRSTTIDSIGYPRMYGSGESSTTKHRLLHASGSHPIPPPNDPNNDVREKRMRHVAARKHRSFDKHTSPICFQLVSSGFQDSSPTTMKASDLGLLCSLSDML